MLDAFEQGDFADCSGWNTVIFLLESDLLECYIVTSDEIFALEHYTVSALSEFLKALIAFKLLGIVAELLLTSVSLRILLLIVTELC